jgi:hypothetical protein
MRELDVLTGPRDGGLAPEELVRCSYVEAHPALAGATPKFLCRRSGDTVMVKWGTATGEIYAEVASTRLLWALGFGADAVYPVRVECSGCADDPWHDRAADPGHVPPPFAPAIIEEKFRGTTIEEKPDQGWRWEELDDIDADAGGAAAAQVDALKLIGAFMQYRDSKAANQRLVCLREGATTSDGLRTCEQPFMMIADNGTTFGGPARVFSHKMNLDVWRGEPVWKDARRCIANVTDEPATRQGLEEPHIREPGRRFLATLLSALDDAQLTALFTAARADQRGGGTQWVEEFKRKRDQIVQVRCPD